MNPALSYAYRKSVPQYKKNDSYDAQCVARVAINELHNLPDAMPEDMYWTLERETISHLSREIGGCRAQFTSLQFK